MCSWWLSILRKLDRRVSIAPMMDWTDRHYRYFIRLMTKRCLLYTEMITTDAIIFGDRDKLLGFDNCEHPLALQVGGSDPVKLSQCAKIAEDWGYDEINLNVGCPSDRVQAGRFGACLMKEPKIVADCVAAMLAAVDIPVTVKTRIGVDDLDSYDYLSDFISTIANTGCKTIIIHARKAWLKGLSPRQNREIPPLRYDVAEQIKKDFPSLEIILNGGIQSVDDIETHSQIFDGVMLGRAAYHQPYLLSEVDQKVHGETQSPLSRDQVIESFMPYVEKQLSKGVRLTAITRHIMGLYHAQPDGNQWRRYLSEHAHLKGVGAKVLVDASSVFGK